MNAEEISSSIITASPQQAGQLVDVVVRAFISDRRAARLRRPLMSAIGTSRHSPRRIILVVIGVGADILVVIGVGADIGWRWGRKSRSRLTQTGHGYRGCDGCN